MAGDPAGFPLVCVLVSQQTFKSWTQWQLIIHQHLASVWTCHKYCLLLIHNKQDKITLQILDLKCIFSVKGNHNNVTLVIYHAIEHKPWRHGNLRHTYMNCIHSVSQNGLTIDQQPCWRAGLRQTKHMVTGSTPWSRFISICLLSHYMNDTLLRLWPKPNGGQALSDVVIHTLYIHFNSDWWSFIAHAEVKYKATM